MGPPCVSLNFPKNNLGEGKGRKGMEKGREEGGRERQREGI